MFQPQPTVSSSSSSSYFAYPSVQHPPSQLQLQFPLPFHGRLGLASHADYGLYPSPAAACTTPSPQASSPGLLAPQANGTFDVAPAPPRPHRGRLQLDHHHRRSTTLAGGVQEQQHLCPQRHLQTQTQTPTHSRAQAQAHQQDQDSFLLLDRFFSANYGYAGRLVRMADPGVHDMAAQQEAAKDYQPNLEVT